MNKIQQTIKEFLEKYNLNNPENTYLCAFSGGYDSMCLLHSLKQITPQNRIVAIHLNHNWRGEESNQEEENCRNFCSEIGVEFYSEKLSSDIPHTETAAREARYEFFESCSKKFNSKIIFTAHNKNDNAETLIYRICKGTGIRGLCGIAENRGIYYRPLLQISREIIEKYCTDFNLKPNNDSSNSDTSYKRNFIRAEILPKLNKKINPNTIEMVNSLSNAAREDTAIVEEYKKAIKIKPNVADAYYSLATAENNLAIDMEQGNVRMNDVDGSLYSQKADENETSEKVKLTDKEKELVAELYDSAVKNYEKYLELNPNAKDKKYVEDLIKQIQEPQAPQTITE